MAEVETKKIGELRKGDNLSFLEGEVAEVEAPREWGEGKQLQQTVIGDKTGFAKFTLFDERVGLFEVGDKVRFTDCWAGLFKDQITVNLRKKKGSDVVVVEKGDGTTKFKYTPQSEAKGNSTSTFNPVLGARQTALQVAGRVHQGTSATDKDLIKSAEAFEEWLNRP